MGLVCCQTLWMVAPRLAISQVTLNETALAQTEAGTPVSVQAYGNLDSLSVTLDWSQAEGQGAWPADMLLEIGLPNGSCVALGGWNVLSESCTDLGDFEAVWPEDWQAGIDSIYAATGRKDFSDTTLSGTGTWTFTIINGYTEGGSSNYGLTLTLNGLCTSDDIDVPGCTDAGACNYNPNATVDDGSCDFASCAGCTDATACNYNPNAQDDDGSCEYESCLGCTEPGACNYDPTATQDDGHVSRPMRVVYAVGTTVLAADARMRTQTTTTPMPLSTTAAASSDQRVQKT